jgi:hypothetical protein
MRNGAVIVAVLRAGRACCAVQHTRAGCYTRPLQARQATYYVIYVCAALRSFSDPASPTLAPSYRRRGQLAPKCATSHSVAMALPSLPCPSDHSLVAPSSTPDILSQPPPDVSDTAVFVQTLRAPFTSSR